MTTLSRFALLIVLTAGMVAGGVWLNHCLMPLTIAHGRKQLDAVPDPGVEPILSNISTKGAPGIALLVEALRRRGSVLARRPGRR